MADKIIFEVVATAKGVKVVQQQTDKLAKSTDKAEKSTKRLDKSRDVYNRREKGAANISSNSTKNFSKMQQGIDGGGGSGGLVRAYALLAANVFALTAAFGVLSRSAQIDTLTKSMEILSVTGGTYIKTLAMDMREASGGAIDLAQSFRQVSLATSAGLNVKEIEGLTQVAKGAALSLGRDLPDAMDRIFRGAIKLEPEILDEIGLFVRVDEAAEKYARSIGKSASSLTQAEKRQGFLNEILDQGSRKFQQYADTIKPDPYVKIAAALSDVAQSALSLVNQAFGPLIGFLAESKGLLTLVFGAVVFSLLRLAVPAIGQFNQGLAESAQQAADNARDYSKGISDTTKAQIKEDNKKVKSALKAQQEINRSTKPLALKVGGKDASSKLEAKLQDKTIKGKKREELVERRILDLEKKQGLEARKKMAGYDEELAALKEERRINKEILDLRTKAGKAKTVSDPGTLADKRQQTLDQRAMTAGALASITGTAETKGMGAAFDELKGKLKETETVGGKTQKKFKGLNKGLFALRGGFGIAAVGAQGLMMSLGPIMMVIGMILPLLIGLGKFLGIGGVETQKLTEATGKLNEVLKNSSDRMKQQTDQMKSNIITYQGAAQATNAFAKGQLDIALRAKEAKEALEDYDKNASGWQKGWDATIRFLTFGQAGIEANSNFAIIQAAAKGMEGAVRSGNETLINLYADVLKGSEKFQKSLEAQMETEKAVEKARKDMGDVGTKRLKELEKATGAAADVLASPQYAPFAKEFARVTKNMTEEEIAFVKESAKLQSSVKVTSRLFSRLTGNTDDVGDALENATKTTKDGVGAIQEYANRAMSLESALEGVAEASGKFSNIFVTSTKADDFAASLTQVTVSAEQSEQGIIGLFESIGKGESQFANFFDDEQIKAFGEATEKSMGTAVMLWTEFVEKVQSYRRDLIVAKTEQKAFNLEIKKLSELTIFGTTIQNTLVQRQTALAQNQEKSAKRSLNARKLQLNVDDDTLKIYKGIADSSITEEQKRAAIDATAKALNKKSISLADIYGLQADELSVQEATYQSILASETETQRAGIMNQKLLQQKNTAQKALNEATAEEVKLQLQLARLLSTGSSTLSTEAIGKAEVKAASDSFSIAKEEATIKKQLLDFEMEVLKIRLRLLRDQPTTSQALKDDIGMTDEEGGATGLFASINNAKTITGEAIDKALESADEKLVVGVTNAVKNGFSGGVSEGISVSNAAIKEVRGNKDLGEDEQNLAVRAIQMTALRETTNSLAEDLKKLGPEGEAVAAITQGALGIIDAYTTFNDVLSATGDNAATFGEKVAAGFAFAASALGQINQMMQAQSRAAISVVDKQIEAEQKRDGKSAESIAKIKAMEKKKEAMKRKAFEQDKKMKMAQTVASTAAGMIGVFAGVRDPFFSMPLAIAQAAIIGAMGAASLAIIAKTSFQGGGSGSVETPKAASLSIGKRDNKVDVARGASGGELSYLRGGRGVGSNANDFRPTGGAYGMKSYAAGGEGILVGEQGPEVVTPTQPVDVTPMTSGGAQSVAFTINAVDAEGVEAVLERQRGNIIGMIRSAANGYGENFLEQVDTDVISEGGYQKA